MNVGERKEQWHNRHRYCHDTPPAMGLDEARWVLDTHAPHGPTCRQYATALDCAVTERIHGR